MQRAAASPISTPVTPGDAPSKRQRLYNGSYNSTASSTPRSDAQAIEEALASEEQKRNEALEREAEERGETKWYLSFKEPQSSVTTTPLRVVSAGYSTLDATNPGAVSPSQEDDGPGSARENPGRRSFGKFNRRIEVSLFVMLEIWSLPVCTEAKQSRFVVFFIELRL